MLPKKESALQINNPGTAQSADGIEMTFYTDPLCCWSWAMRPHWQQFLSFLTVPVNVTYKMAGLLPSWKHFNDTTNAISKPVQMGPEWMHARGVTGADIQEKIWVADPPASSFPACIAVIAAGCQSPVTGQEYLYQAQLAVMTQCRNVAKREVLLDIAARVHAIHPDFDVAAFRKDLLGDKPRDIFRKDMQEAKFLNITRLPTIVFRSRRGPATITSGYQTTEMLVAAAKKVSIS